jgi:hypothetical protein
MLLLFLFTRCKTKQLEEEVSYQQIAAAFNREDLIIYTNQKSLKTTFSLKFDDSVAFNEFWQLWRT